MNLCAVTGSKVAPNERKHVQHFHSESVSAMAVATTNGHTPPPFTDCAGVAAEVRRFPALAACGVVLANNAVSYRGGQAEVGR